jgi:hypothetical protein
MQKAGGRQRPAAGAWQHPAPRWRPASPGGTGLAGAPFHNANRGAVYLFGL